MRRRVNAPYMYKVLMQQDWVTRHVSLRNLSINDQEIYCMMLQEFLSPCEALEGMSSGTRGYKLPKVMPMGNGPVRLMTLCNLFQMDCRCHNDWSTPWHPRQRRLQRRLPSSGLGCGRDRCPTTIAASMLCACCHRRTLRYRQCLCLPRVCD